MHTSSPPPELMLQTIIRPRASNMFHRRRLAELLRRLDARREVTVLRRALDLAGQPNSILDIPCGTGRLWPLLLKKTNRLLIGADDCADMLAVAAAAAPQAEADRLRCLQTVTTAIDLPGSAVDCIFCVRLFSRVGSATQRQRILQEFHRVTRDTLIISLWVDGNLQARQRTVTQQTAPTENAPHPRYITPRHQFEAEFTTAGFIKLGHIDTLPLCRMTRTYVLRKR